MTLRARTSRPTSRRISVRRLFEGEERQQATLTALFVLVIGAIVLILLLAIGFDWYDKNVRAVARVGSVEIGPQLLTDRLELEQWRIQLERNRLTTASIDHQIDAATLASRNSELDQRATALQTTGLDDLVDIIYKSQLAVPEGISVTEADVDAAIAKEFNSVERRHVLAIFVEPGADKPDTEDLSNTDRLVALQRAQDALAAIQSGRPWADVAREFSTDQSAQNGGDYGVVSEIGVVDPDFGARLFELPVGGTTGIVRGTDGTYRIGQVTEIIDAPEEPGLRDGLLKSVPDQSLRQIVRYEVAADKLGDKITDAALTATPEQVRIAIIYIEGIPSGDPEDAQGEVDYSEIVFAPKNDLTTAPDLPKEDPAWEAARVEAQATYDELAALPIGDVRVAKFREIATANSDSPTKDDGGAAGFISRGIAPTEVGKALFDTAHLPGDLIGPIRDEAAWYVLLFHERRDSPDQRIATVKAELAKPGADFTALAKLYSDGPEADDGGEVGWVSRDQLAEELVDKVFALSVGQVTEPLELGEGNYFIKVEEKTTRPLDPDQVSGPEGVRATAFANWYGPKRDEAEANGTIVFAEATTTTDEGVPGGG
jgi:parvulin-like peptidyl-prolyl isomerase